MPRYQIKIERGSEGGCEVDLPNEQEAKELAKSLFNKYSPKVPTLFVEAEYEGVNLQAITGNGGHRVALWEMTETGCLKRWLDVWTK